jgi:hypothetical protein
VRIILPKRGGYLSEGVQGPLEQDQKDCGKNGHRYKRYG